MVYQPYGISWLYDNFLHKFPQLMFLQHLYPTFPWDGVRGIFQSVFVLPHWNNLLNETDQQPMKTIYHRSIMLHSSMDHRYLTPETSQVFSLTGGSPTIHTRIPRRFHQTALIPCNFFYKMVNNFCTVI